MKRCAQVPLAVVSHLVSLAQMRENPSCKASLVRGSTYALMCIHVRVCVIMIRLRAENSVRDTTTKHAHIHVHVYLYTLTMCSI